MESSGHTVDQQITRSFGSGPNGSTQSVSYQERILPRLDINDVVLASDHPQQSILRISRGEGYAQYGGLPFIAQAEYHITEAEYERRKTTPWPEGVAGSFVPTRNRPAPATRPSGPVVTTEVIGPQSNTAPSAADLFSSYLQSSSEENP